MGHATSSNRGNFRSVRENTGIADLTREQLRELALSALDRTDFPQGINDLEVIDIARQMLTDYVDEENAW